MTDVKCKDVRPGDLYFCLDKSSEYDPILLGITEEAWSTTDGYRFFAEYDFTLWCYSNDDMDIRYTNTESLDKWLFQTVRFDEDDDVWRWRNVKRRLQ